jgi:hypothetical protein
VFLSERDRTSGPELLSEGIATLGLILVIQGAVRYRKPYVVGVAVGAWIGGAYFFTSSTSFANPMISIARTLSDTFAGIAPASAAAYVGVELLGALVAFAVIPVLFGRPLPGRRGLA